MNGNDALGFVSTASSHIKSIARCAGLLLRRTAFVVGLGVLLLWPRSYCKLLSVDFSSSEGAVSALSECGRIQFVGRAGGERGPRDSAWWYLRLVSSDHGAGILYYDWAVGTVNTKHGLLWLPWQDPLLPFLIEIEVGRNPEDESEVWHRAITVPHWFLAALLAMPTLIALARGHPVRQWRRRRLGLCLQCGYDLRASGDRCPECGTRR